MLNRQATPSFNRPLVLIGMITFVLYFARDVLIPLALALTISFLLTPVVTAFEKLRFRRVPAVIITTILFAGAVGAMSWFVGAQLVAVLSDLPEYRINIHNKIAALHTPTSGPFGKVSQTVKEIGKELSLAPEKTPVVSAGTQRARAGAAPTLPAQTGTPIPVEVVPAPVSDLEYVADFLMPVLKPIGVAGVVIVFAIFILIKREDLRNRILRLVGLGQLNLMTQALDDGTKRISRYLMMQFLVNAGYGILFGAGLYFIGVPSVLLWGAIAALLRIVPYVGTFVAAALPTLMALAVFDGWHQPLLVVALYMFLEGVTGNFIEPWLYGAHTGISSLALLVATVFWTLLWGWAGLVLSTPLTVCAIVLGRYAPQWSFLDILLGDEAPLAPHAHYYQRLLAMDQTEAREVADRFLEGKPLVRLYDEVLLPALNLAEQDRHKGALDEARGNFLLLSASELISELAEYVPAAGSDTQTNLQESLDEEGGKSHRVICIPASDQADQITALMLAQLLEQANCGTILLPLDSPIEDVLTAMELDDRDVVCISAVPPFAFSAAQAMCKRVRANCPNVKLLVGLWGLSGDVEKAAARFGRQRPDGLHPTLAGAIEQIREWQFAAVPVISESTPA